MQPNNLRGHFEKLNLSSTKRYRIKHPPDISERPNGYTVGAQALIAQQSEGYLRIADYYNKGGQATLPSALQPSVHNHSIAYSDGLSQSHQERLLLSKYKPSKGLEPVDAAMYSEHFSLPLPSIENLAYNEGHHMSETDSITQQAQYNLDMVRAGAFEYRHLTDSNFPMQPSHGTDHGQSMEPLQQGNFCSPPYYHPSHAWQTFDNGMGLPGLTPGSSQVGANARNRIHKRSRMSLQKRLLVNARERERMRVLNKAFEALRDALPCYIADGHMAKITTLRLAINYIKALTEVLNEQSKNDAEKEKTKDTKLEEELDMKSNDDNDDKNVKENSQELSVIKNTTNTSSEEIETTQK